MQYNTAQKWSFQNYNGTFASFVIADVAEYKNVPLFFLILTDCTQPQLIAGRDSSVFVCTKSCLDASAIELQSSTFDFPDIAFEKAYYLQELDAEKMSPIETSLGTILRVYAVLNGTWGERCAGVKKQSKVPKQSKVSGVNGT